MNVRAGRVIVVAILVVLGVGLVYWIVEREAAMGVGTPSGLSTITVGQCFEEERQVAAVVPCNGPHMYEMIGIVALPDGPYPKNIFDLSYTTCEPLRDSYVGTDGLEPEFWSWAPLEGEWSDGARTVYCTRRIIQRFTIGSPSA